MPVGADGEGGAVCLYCQSAPADLGRYCTGCYVEALGEWPLLGDPADPWYAFNLDAEKHMADARLQTILGPRLAARWTFLPRLSAWKLRPTATHGSPRIARSITVAITPEQEARLRRLGASVAVREPTRACSDEPYSEELTDAQVQAGARPGESWEQARCRLLVGFNTLRFDDCSSVGHDADYTLSGPVDECEGLDGQPIRWEPGEFIK